MDIQEIKDRIAKQQNIVKEQDCIDIVQWCIENVDKINLQDKDHLFMCEKATKYLINYKLGKWTKDDAKVIVNYLAKKTARKMGIDENVTIKILESTEFENTHGISSSAVCINNGDDTFDISYSPKVIDNLLSNNYDLFLIGMQTIFHEVVHAQQNSVIQRANIKGLEIPKTKAIYIMALETIARKQNPKFYDENYTHLLKENHAEKIGLKDAMETMKKYNPNLYKAYNQEIIQKRLENYDKNFYDATVTLESGKEYDFMQQIDTLSSIYIEQHPEIVEKFSILQVGYNLDGTKKELSKLLLERDDMLANSKSPEKVDELYEAIVNHRNVITGGLKGTKDELVSLDDYITRTGTEDEFVFNLVKYRLENKTKMTPEQITEFMNREYATAAKIRQERQEQEIEHEEEKSIKDEVGDEFKPKTDMEEQENQQVDEMWKNRFQSWDRNAMTLPNVSKRKKEATQVISDVIKQKDKERKEIQEQEQDEEQMRG